MEISFISIKGKHKVKTMKKKPQWQIGFGVFNNSWVE
jgi:hypothetical protein